MPSYRVTLGIGDRIEVPAPSLLPRIGAACAEIAEVESQDVRIVHGAPSIVVRFAASADSEAIEVARHTHEAAARLAALTRVELTRRVHGEWRAVA